MPSIRGGSVVPFVANSGHLLYHREIQLPGVRADIMAKSRKWAFTTQRIGEQLHGCMYHAGRIGRTLAQRDQTLYLLKRQFRALYLSAWARCDEFAARFGDRRGAAYFMPHNRSKADSVYEFDEISSAIYIETAGGVGVGQADRTDDLYCTEYQVWARPEESYEGLEGSVPMDAQDYRITIDFNADRNWMGSDAYVKWRAALLPHNDPEWNGFHASFIGVADVPEWYPPAEQEKRKRRLRDAYALAYPEKPEDMYLQRARACHRREEIDAAYQRTGGRFLLDVLAEEHGGRDAALARIARMQVVHGVDCALAHTDESDFSECVSFAWHESMWWELCEPIHARIEQDLLARQVFDERLRVYGGVVVPERNQGEAFMIALRDLIRDEGHKLPHGGEIYRHRERGKDGRQRTQPGFPTTGDGGARKGTKSLMITEANELLRNGELGLVSQVVREQFGEVEFYLNDDGSPGRGLAGAPKRKGAHDDAWMAVLLAMQGRAYGRSGLVMV